jgi:hypothetical protein
MAKINTSEWSGYATTPEKCIDSLLERLLGMDSSEQKPYLRGIREMIAEIPDRASRARLTLQLWITCGEAKDLDVAVRFGRRIDDPRIRDGFLIDLASAFLVHGRYSQAGDAAREIGSAARRAKMLNDIHDYVAEHRQNRFRRTAERAIKRKTWRPSPTCWKAAAAAAS